MIYKSLYNIDKVSYLLSYSKVSDITFIELTFTIIRLYWVWKADVFKINCLKEPAHNIADESKFELIGKNDDSCITYTTCNKKNQYLDEKTSENIKRS